MADPRLQRQQNPPEEPRIYKVPTGLASEPLNIIILGASYAGLACAHHFLDYTTNRLRTSKTSPNYRLVIISPSTHLYWNIAAPRALVSPNLLNHDDLFIPLEDGFHRHRAHNFIFVQGEAVAMDPSARTITIELIGSTAQKRASQINKRFSRQIRPVSMQSMGAKVQTMPYHAIIMATGSSAHSELLTLHGPHLNTIGALTNFHARVAAAKSIVVARGGCSGVETAGQLATYLNYRSHWPIRRRVRSPKQIILITGSDRCLPMHKKVISVEAEKMLKKLGVEIKHGIRVIAAKEGFDLTGQTSIELSDYTSVIADLFIPCTGAFPNSSYVPVEMRDAGAYIRTNPRTLRVSHPLAGVRTYAIGDVASYSQNNINDVYAAVPVLMRNLLNDLLAYEYHLDDPTGGNKAKVDKLIDEVYFPLSKSPLLCPISRFGGVGLGGSGFASNMPLPKTMVHALKGRDYRVSKTKKVVVDGGNPYSVGGKFTN